MDIRRRRAQLHLLARRPSGFPELIEDGELVFESSQDGWYEPVPLGREDGSLLADGIRVGVRANGGRYHLQLRQARAVPLTPSEEYTGFVSDRVLRAEAACAVLCVEALGADVARYLGALTGEPVHARRDDTIPSGWCLFTDIRAIRECPPPPGLENLAVESSLALIPEGGLRLGRRWTWLESAPAQLTSARLAPRPQHEDRWAGCPVRRRGANSDRRARICRPAHRGGRKPASPAGDSARGSCPPGLSKLAQPGQQWAQPDCGPCGALGAAWGCAWRGGERSRAVRRCLDSADIPDQVGGPRGSGPGGYGPSHPRSWLRLACFGARSI